MGFLRNFDIAKMNKLTVQNADLFERLKFDVFSGEVFPAVRKDELHFYYNGGCLYRCRGGIFNRSKDYDKFGGGTDTPTYDEVKRRIDEKFVKADGSSKERRLLSRLYGHTYRSDCPSDVVVLDIEVRLNGASGGGKKCDMVLLNAVTGEIMFVEGKVYSDERVLTTAGIRPRVIEQVGVYTAAVAEQREEIAAQYGRHIEIMNALFGTAYPSRIELIEPVKLLVFETPHNPTMNGCACIDAIHAELGATNVVWYRTGESPSVTEIWKALCK